MALDASGVRADGWLRDWGGSDSSVIWARIDSK
jgi:hypothetical protein